MVSSDIKYGASSFSSVLFKHIRRQSNVLSHDLAKSSMNYDGLCVFHSTPECIRETLCNYVA